MSADAATDFTELDNAGISKEHRKIMLISGMGFFTDAYDLFIIGVVMSISRVEPPAIVDAPR
jgi:MFS transporter, PHS family, inorganic phosphate transporter